MPAKKMRVEVFDEEGNRYNVTLEGKVTKQRALCLFDIVELLGSIHDEQPRRASEVGASKFDKTRSIIESSFRLRWFSSRDVLLAYEEEFKEPISLSTVSTYLARMVDRSFLNKKGAVHNLKYRMATDSAQNNLNIVKSR